MKRLKSKFAKLAGAKLGRLSVVRSERRDKKSMLWCVCDCGTEKWVSAPDAARGRIISCGCAHREMVSQINNKGGVSKHSLYKTWLGMRARCSNQNEPAYKDYGGRGITVCERWDSFEIFLEDMGPKPSPAHSLDRIDNDGNYEPSNCRWATRTEQNSNQRKRAGEPWMTGSYRSCNVCGKEYYVPKHKASSAKYCSRSCMYERNTIQI